MKKKGKRTRGIVIAATALCCLALAGFCSNASARDAAVHEGLEVFADVIDILEKSYVDPVDTRAMILKGLEGMLSGLDPHSSVMPPEDYEELQADTRGEFGGVGVVITMKDDRMTVVSSVEGSPAQKAGIKAGDVIFEVDGVSVKGMSLWDAVNKLRGAEGEMVMISIERAGEAGPLLFSLVRDIIPIISVRHLPLEQGFGYVRIAGFQESTTHELEVALGEMDTEAHPLKGLILDLRDNPGGLLEQAIGVSDVFLDEGVIVSIKGRLQNEAYEAHRNADRRMYPLVVLVNGGSASASEIVAGALQDNKRAVILGTATFGKGSVQSVMPLDDGYALKYTIYRYFTPSGRSIQATGIIPDIEVKQTAADEVGEKELENISESLPLGGGGENPADEKAGDSKATDDEEDSEAPGYRYGEPTPEDLRNDNQVMRALQLLKGYRIFAEARS